MELNNDLIYDNPIKNDQQKDTRSGEQAPHSVHRVGTVTCGLVFILYGIMFLLHMVIPQINYMFIFGLWPLVLIFLGVEILLGCRHKNLDKQKFVYDFPAVLLIMIMMLFTMLMAAVDYGIQHEGYDGYYIYYSSSYPTSLL